MSEMIERVATAILDVEDRFTTWDNPAARLLRESILAKARAAIEAMRNPTHDMILAGEMKNLDNMLATGNIWGAMVDAALGKEAAPK